MDINELIKDRVPLFKKHLYLELIVSLIESHIFTKPKPKTLFSRTNYSAPKNYWHEITKASLNEFNSDLYLPNIMAKYLLNKSMIIYDRLRLLSKKINRPVMDLLQLYRELCTTPMIRRNAVRNIITKKHHNDILKLLSPNKEQDDNEQSKNLFNLFIGHLSVENIFKNKQHITIKTTNNLKTFIFSQVDGKQTEREKEEEERKKRIEGNGSVSPKHKVKTKTKTVLKREKEPVKLKTMTRVTSLTKRAFPQTGNHSKEKSKSKSKEKKKMILAFPKPYKTIDMSDKRYRPKLKYKSPDKTIDSNLPNIPATSSSRRYLTLSIPIARSMKKNTPNHYHYHYHYQYQSQNNSTSNKMVNYMSKSDLYY